MEKGMKKEFLVDYKHWQGKGLKWVYLCSGDAFGYVWFLEQEIKLLAMLIFIRSLCLKVCDIKVDGG